MFPIHQFETRTFWFEREGKDTAVGRTAAKIHEEEMIPVSSGHTSTGKISNSGRAAGDVSDGWNDVGRLAFEWWVPQPFRVERAPRIGVLHKLISHAPTIVAAVDKIYPAGLVAAVRVVIAGEQIAMLIEDQVLRVAQTVSEHLEFGAVRIAAENAPGIRLA